MRVFLARQKQSFCHPITNARKMHSFPFFFGDWMIFEFLSGFVLLGEKLSWNKISSRLSKKKN